MNSSASNTDEYLKDIPNWQQANLTLFRDLVHAAHPEICEEIKWGVPVFLVDKKIVFAMSSFKAHTKFNFILNGALLEDSDNLFNNGLESKKSRGIDLHVGQTIDEAQLTALINQALAKL